MGRLEVAPDGKVDGGLRLWRLGQPAQLLDGPPPWTCEYELGDVLRLADATSDEVEWVVSETLATVTLRPGVQLQLSYRGPWTTAETIRAGYLRVQVVPRQGTSGRLVATLTPGGGAVSSLLPLGTALSFPTTDRALAAGSLRFELLAEGSSRSLGTARLASLQLGVAVMCELKEHPAQRAVRHQFEVTLLFEPFQRSPMSAFRHLFIVEARNLVAPERNLLARVSLPPPATTIESPLALSNSGAEWAWHWTVPVPEMPALSTLPLTILDATSNDATVGTCEVALSETPAWVPLAPRGELLVVAAREADLATVRLTRLCNLPTSTKTFELRCGGDVVLSTRPLTAHCSSALSCVDCDVELSVRLEEPILSLTLLLDNEVRLSRDVCATSSTAFIVALSSTIRVGFGADARDYEHSPRRVWVSLVAPLNVPVVLTWEGRKRALSPDAQLELAVDDCRTAVFVLEAADASRGYIFGDMLTDGSVAMPWQGPVPLVLSGSVRHEVVCRIASQPCADETQEELFSDVTSPVQYVPGPGTLYLQLTSSVVATMRISTSNWSATHVPPSSSVMAVPLHWSPDQRRCPSLEIHVTDAPSMSINLAAWLLQPRERSFSSLPIKDTVLALVFLPGPPMSVTRLPPQTSEITTMSVSIDNLSLDQVPASIASVQLLVLLQTKTVSSATCPVVGGRANIDAPLLLDAVSLSTPGCNPLLTFTVLHGETQTTLATAVTPLFPYITDKGHVAMLALPALAATGDRVCVVNVHLHAVRKLVREASDDTGLLLTFHDVKGSPQWYQTNVFLCALGDTIETTTTSATKTEPSVLLPHNEGFVRIDMYQGVVIVGSGSVKAVPNKTRQWTSFGNHQVLISLLPAAAPAPVVGKLYLEPLEAKVAFSWKSPYLRLRAGDLDVYKSNVYKLSDGAPKWTDHVVLSVPTLPLSVSCGLFSRGASLGQTNGSASLLAPVIVSDANFQLDDWLALEQEAGHVHIQGTFLPKLRGDVHLVVTKLVLSSAVTTSGLPTTITASVPPSLASSSTLPLHHQLPSVPSAPVVFSVTNAQASSKVPSLSLVVQQGPVVIATASLPLLEVWRRPIPSRWYPLLDRISKDEVGAIRVDLTFTPAMGVASDASFNSTTLGQWKKLFYQIDSDHSGSISLRELGAALQGNVALQTLLLPATDSRSVEAQIMTLFQHLDSNSDGEVTFDEYVAGMQAHQQATTSVTFRSSAVTSVDPVDAQRIEALEAQVEQLTAALAQKECDTQASRSSERSIETPEVDVTPPPSARPVYAKHTEWRTTQLSLEYDTSPETLKEQNRQLRAQLHDAEAARRLAVAKHVQENEKVKRRVQNDRALAHHHLLHRTPPRELHDDVVVEGKLAMLTEEVQRLRDVNAHLLRMQLQDAPRSREDGDACGPPENADPELLGRSTELHALRQVHQQLQSDHADVADRCQKLEDDLGAAQRLLGAQTERCQSLQQQLHQATLALQQSQQTRQAQTTRSTVVQSALALELDRQARLQTQRQAARVAQTTASILLQSKVRMRLQQKRYQAAKMQRAAAVVLLQSRVRGRFARLRFRASLRVHRAAVCIQSNVRRFVCRSKFVHLQAGRWTAARLLQAHVRRWQVQSHLRHIRIALVLLQASVRRWRAQRCRHQLRTARTQLLHVLWRHVLRGRAKKAQVAATRLQRAWRRHLVRLDAAVLIQRHARGHVTRRKLVRERTLGAWLRMFVLRRRFWRARDASTKIQGRWRQWHIFLAETEAAIAVQSVYRSHRSRRSVRKSQAAATAIQLVWRRRQQTATNATTSTVHILGVDGPSQVESATCEMMDAPTLEATDIVEPDVEFGSDGDMALPPADNADDDALESPEVAALSYICTQESSGAAPPCQPEASNTLSLVADGTEMGAQDPVEAAFTTHDEDVFGADGDMALPPDDEVVESVWTSTASIDDIGTTLAVAAETPALSSSTPNAHLGSVQESSWTVSDLHDVVAESTDGGRAVKDGEVEAAEAATREDEGDTDEERNEASEDEGDGEEDEEEEEGDEETDADEEEGDDEEEETDADEEEEEEGDEEEEQEDGDDEASGGKAEDSPFDTAVAKPFARADDDAVPHEASATPREAMVAVQSGTSASTVERSDVASSSESELSTCTTDDASLRNKPTTSMDDAFIQATTMVAEGDEHEVGATSIDAAADALCTAVDLSRGAADAAADTHEAAPSTIHTLETRDSPVDHSNVAAVPTEATANELHSEDSSPMVSKELVVNEAECLTPATGGAEVLSEPGEEATSVDEAPKMAEPMAFNGDDHEDASDEAPANALCAASEPVEVSDDTSMDEPEHVEPTTDATVHLMEPHDDASNAMEKAASSTSPVNRFHETIMDERHRVDASPATSEDIPSLVNEAEQMTAAADGAREADVPANSVSAASEGDDHGVASAPSDGAPVDALCTALELSTASLDFVQGIGKAESSRSGSDDGSEPVARTEPPDSTTADEPARAELRATEDNQIQVFATTHSEADASPMASARVDASSSALVLDADEILRTDTLAPDPVAARIEASNECESKKEEPATSTASDALGVQLVEADTEQAAARRSTEPATNSSSGVESFSTMAEAEASAIAPVATSRIDGASDEAPPPSDAILDHTAKVEPAQPPLSLVSNDLDNDEPSTNGVDIGNPPTPDTDCPQSVTELSTTPPFQDLTGSNLTPVESASVAPRTAAKEDDTNVFTTPIPSHDPASPTQGGVVASPRDVPMVESTDSVPTNVELNHNE